MKVRYLHNGAVHFDSVSYLKEKVMHLTRLQEKILSGDLEPEAYIGTGYPERSRKAAALGKLESELSQYQIRLLAAQEEEK